MTSKKYVLIFIILLSCNLSFTQIAEFEARYEYTPSDVMEESYDGGSTLYFNDSVSITTFDKYMKRRKDKSQNNLYKIHIYDEEGFPIYTNLKDQIQVFKRIPLINNEIIVTDTIIDMNWKLKEKREVVNGYICFIAKGNHAERNYTAWYTTEIPYPFGPFKFHGLPGLIVKIQSEDKDITIDLKRVNPISKENYIIDKPTDGVKLSWREYEKAYFNLVEEYNASTENKLLTDSKESIEKGKYQLLRRYYRNKGITDYTIESYLFGPKD